MREALLLGWCGSCELSISVEGKKYDEIKNNYCLKRHASEFLCIFGFISLK